MSKATSTPASMEPLAIGIDIGGTGTKFGIVDRVGNVLFSGEISTKKHKKVETFIDELHEKLSALITNSGRYRAGSRVLVWVRPMEIFIQALLNMLQIFPGKELFRWPN